MELIQDTADVKLPGQVTVSLASTDMSAVVPVQYLADMVVLITDAATGEAALAVIIEPQLRGSDTKHFSWPVYVTTARRVARCPAAVLVVLCPDPAEAAKCRTLIRTGHPGFDLAPIVIDSGGPPGQDGGSPFLTVFAASMGGIDLESETGARRLVDAMASNEVSDADRRRMTAIIMTVVSDAARQILETMMQTGDYPKTFLDRAYDDGEAKGKAEAVLRLLDARHLSASTDQRERVASCTDIAQLDLWFDRAVTANGADEVFVD